MFEIEIVKYHSNPDSEYCGRGSVLGNPFPITDKDTRDKVCDMFDDYFYQQLKKQ